MALGPIPSGDRTVLQAFRTDLVRPMEYFPYSCSVRQGSIIKFCTYAAALDVWARKEHEGYGT